MLLSVSIVEGASIAVLSKHEILQRLERSYHTDPEHTVAYFHDDVIKWKHFPRYWPFVWEFTRHRWIPHTKASDAELWYFLWSAWINGWVNNDEAGDLGRHRSHYDVRNANVTGKLQTLISRIKTPRDINTRSIAILHEISSAILNTIIWSVKLCQIIHDDHISYGETCIWP